MVKVMKTILIVLIMVLIANTGCSAITPEPKDWLTESNSAFIDEHKLPETRYSEVQITKLMTAVDTLNEKSAIPLSDELAKYYAGPFFKAENGFTPFLVRGLFANYTGMFFVFWSDGELSVEHYSLGSNFNPEFCPLVVNLPSEPRKVFVGVGGAK